MCFADCWTSTVRSLYRAWRTNFVSSCSLAGSDLSTCPPWRRYKSGFYWFKLPWDDCAQTPALPSERATWCTWSCGCCQPLTLSNSRHLHMAGSEAAPLSFPFPPFTAPHWHTHLADWCLCVCFRLLLMHEALISHPHCLRCTPASVHLNQTFLLSTISLLLAFICPGSSLTFANETYLHAEPPSRSVPAVSCGNDKRQKLVPP